MPVIISHDQLIGRFQVTQNQKKASNVEEYIDSIEKSFIIKLLGATLGNEFWDDLDSEGAPVEQRFLNIFEPFDIDTDCGIQSSKGIIEILLALTYAQYTRDADIFNTDVGNQTTAGENSTRVDPSAKIVKAYNDAIDSVKAIQWYICENEQNYEGYNGQKFHYWMLF